MRTPKRNNGTELEASCQLKLDLDKVDIVWWMCEFTNRYWQLQDRGLWIGSGSVFATKNGYHVYLVARIDNYSFEKALLFESLFGSDDLKQFYAYVEGSDILFRSKKGIVEKRLMHATRVLEALIGYANERSTPKLLKFVI